MHLNPVGGRRHLRKSGQAPPSGLAAGNIRWEALREPGRACVAADPSWGAPANPDIADPLGDPRPGDRRRSPRTIAPVGMPIAWPPITAAGLMKSPPGRAQTTPRSAPRLPGRDRRRNELMWVDSSPVAWMRSHRAKPDIAAALRRHHPRGPAAPNYHRFVTRPEPVVVAGAEVAHRAVLVLLDEVRREQEIRTAVAVEIRISQSSEE